ncbi:hypothetical protein TSOC_000024 [Tetrabaena socialis]|uniref:Uncharacterized protein n=1 Tax=Tetrabaena socialis TaxID=47790 RepID=A0A2J8AKG6_9CHLO|nr:hypothetical protein TSOC_000024 [Tetrabaena socialis]|eukprot:PNH13011.1 hypothetical protein TSOC_000024 [Tetrabaena socialis]
MEGPNMIEAIQRPVLELAEVLDGALLYLDAGAGEIAQTTLGLPFLLGLGVSHVCSLELASPEDAAFPLLVSGQEPTRLAVFTTQLLTDAHPHVLRAVMAHPRVASVTLHCSVSEHAHACQAATDLGVEAYREYAELLQCDVRRARMRRQADSPLPAPAPGAASNDSAAAAADGFAGAAPSASAAPEGTAAGEGGVGGLAVRVSFLPLLACCPDPGLFVLPAASSAARRGVSGGLAAGFGPLEATASDSAAAWGEGASGGLALTAHALLALAAAMGFGRPAPFPIGPVSSAIAAELASLPTLAAATPPSYGGGGGTNSSGGSNGGPSGGLALVLVDRSLDLAAPTCHGDQPWDVVLAAVAARQAAAAVAASMGAGHGGGGQEAVWRPLDLRVGPLDGADPVPLLAPSSASPSAAAPPPHLVYGQLSYGTYGVELLDPNDRTAIARVEAVSGRPRKDGLAALRRGLKEALRSERLAPAVRSKAGAVQAPELRGLAETLLGEPGGACLN